jgi:hypothetical protein
MYRQIGLGLILKFFSKFFESPIAYIQTPKQKVVQEGEPQNRK